MRDRKSGFSVPSAADAPVLGGSASCDEPLRAQEHRWGGTGEWRTLAPYPRPREASPTDSIGVWLERSHLPNGEIELRRVSAALTVVATSMTPGCDMRLVSHHRSFSDSAAAGEFTDAALRDLVNRTKTGMVYTWSPRMPLSILGLTEARAAAKSLGIAFTAVVADASSDELRSARVDSADQHSLNSIDLVYRNATIHYPSATFYRDGSLIGGAVPGFKSQETYAELARDAFAEAEAGRSRWTTPRTESTPTFWVDHNARVTTVRTIPTPRAIGFFFKPVAGTDLISYTSPDSGASYLFDLGTRRELRIPGNVDPVPTPDGRFITRPGLLFHRVASLLSGDTAAMFLDRELPDQYQTASILKRSATLTRYRVVTGWGMGARMRDYDVTTDRSGKPTHIEPLGRPNVPCPERAFSLPISAKAGTEFGAYDKVSKTNRIIKLTEDGKCNDVLDLGFASGKLAFSYDGQAVAFATSRIDLDAEGSLLKPDEMFYKDAIVLYRKTGRLVALSSNRPLAGMTFPEFLPDGRIILLDQRTRLRSNEVIRVVEVR